MTARQERNIRRAAERELKKREERAAKLSRETENIPAAATPSVPPTPTRAEINRANAAHSTGPRTAEGKAKSKDNSFKHGLYSSELVLPDEDPAELDELRATLRAEHQPANETEDILVNEIAENFWRLRRMRNLEARGLQPENFDSWLQRGLLALVARNMASAERSMHKAIAALRQMRSERTNLARQTQSAAMASFLQILPPSRKTRSSFGKTILKLASFLHFWKKSQARR